MHLLAKATKFFHKPSTMGAPSALPSKVAPTGPSRIAPGLTINRRGRELKGLRTGPAQTLYIGDIGQRRYEDVRELLQGINGLEFGYGDIAAVSRLSEEALDPLAKAIGILVEDGQLKGACKLIDMVKSELRPALLKRCSADVKVLRDCPDADVRKVMNRVLHAAGRHALCGQDFSRFLKLLPFCSPETAASLEVLFPPLTIDMVRALDETMLVNAVDMTVDRIMKLDRPEACLAELESLLSIAGKLQGPDLPRGVVMKCIIWECLGMGGVPDPVVLGKLKQLQYKTLLPALTPALLERIPDEFKGAVSRVVKEQVAMSQNVKEGFNRLPADPYRELFGFPDALEAGDLTKAARLIHDLPDTAFRDQASGKLFAVVAEKLIEGLLQKLERKDAEATKREASMELEMAAVLAMAGHPSLTERIEAILSRADSEPGQFTRVLLEKLGFPAGGDPISQMIEALPTLCDDHPFALDFILRTDQGKERVAQAVMNGLSKQRYNPATVASLVMALADRIDLQSIFVKEIGQDKWGWQLKAPAMMTMVIDLLKSGVPRGAEAAEKILSLTQDSKAARESLRAQMCALLPTLCDGDHLIERDFILRTKTGERLVAQAVEDYLVQDELDDAIVSSLFTALAHRVDLRTTDLFSFDASSSINNAWASRQRWSALINKLGRVRLDGESTLLLDASRPGWRLLLLPRLNGRFFEGTSIYGVLSAKAIDAAAADAHQGGVKERMNSPDLRYVIPQMLEGMLKIDVAGEPFLSVHALINVMRAVVSDKALAEATLEWLDESKMDIGGRTKVFTAMASALIELQQDLTPSRYDRNLLANHAVAAVAAQMNKRFKGDAWWESFVSRGLLSADLAPEAPQ